jgi:hypothetical protein
MGTVTGTTQDRLSLVKTYNPAQPYVVGVNGVTDVYTDAVGRGHVKYIIDGIEYHTILTKNFNEPGKPNNLKRTALNINSPLSGNKSYVPQARNSKKNELGGSSPGGDIVYPTTFRYTTQPYTDITSYFVFKDEAKMGVVFTPKVEEDVFIERQSMSVYEPHNRLGEIINIQELEDYNNGYYNIIKNE